MTNAELSDEDLILTLHMAIPIPLFTRIAEAIEETYPHAVFSMRHSHGAIYRAASPGQKIEEAR